MIIHSKRVSESVALDLDEADQVVSIEVLHVRESGIDPLAMQILHVTADLEVTCPDPEAILAGQQARAEALKHKREQAKAAQDVS